MSLFVEGAVSVSQSLGGGDTGQEQNLLSTLRKSMVWMDDVLSAARTVAEGLIDRFGVDIQLTDIPAEALTGIDSQLKSVDWLLHPRGRGSGGVGVGVAWGGGRGVSRKYCLREKSPCI